MRSHFTSTAFVVHDRRTLLHWHSKIQQWMPPGGHLLPDEDPVAGALREVREETTLNVELLPTPPAFEFSEPTQITPPVTILFETSAEAGEPHHHIDFIYFSRPLEGEALRPLPETDSWTWVDEHQLKRREAIPYNGGSAPVPDDVRALGLEAIRLEREAGTKKEA